MDNKKQQLKDLLRIHFGFKDFRFGQEKAIDSILKKQDSLVIMPTGGGKSLIYQLPSLVLDGVTLVVSPLIALMKVQVFNLYSICIPANFINYSFILAELEQRVQGVKNREYKLLYIAPERFNNHAFVQNLKEIPVDLFAVDEAHCISEWGHDFRPSYTRLNQAVELAGRPPVVALTATATPEVKDDIIKQLNLKDPEVIVTGFSRPNLQFGVIQTTENQKTSILTDSIKYLPEIKGIVYTGTRAKADEITRALLDEGVNAVSYHAGMDGDDRKWVQENFMKDKVEVVVATNAFGLGIDKKDIRFVIHHDMPGTVEAYYQEAGRAGRDGRSSFCLLLYSSKDRNLREFFIRGDNPSPNTIIEIYDTLLSYEQDKVLFTYNEFGQMLSENAPDMAIGTGLKILEKEGFISRVQEKTSNAYLRLNLSWEEAFKKVGLRARSQKKLLTKLKERYRSDLEEGVYINLEEVADILEIKKESLKRSVRSLTEKKVLEYHPPFKGTEVNILKRVSPEDLDIDFTNLKEKARQAYDKLDKVEDYVYSYDCRQKFILDYFGDRESSGCGQCDNCLNSPTKKNSFSKVAKKEDKKIKINTKLTQLETWEFYKKGLDLNQIAEQRGLKKETIVDHVCFLIKKGLLSTSDLNELVSPTIQKKILKITKKTGTEKLKPIKEALGEDVSYQDIKLVLAKNSYGQKH